VTAEKKNTQKNVSPGLKVGGPLIPETGVYYKQERTNMWEEKKKSSSIARPKKEGKGGGCRENKKKNTAHELGKVTGGGDFQEKKDHRQGKGVKFCLARRNRKGGPQERNETEKS